MFPPVQDQDYPATLPIRSSMLKGLHPLPAHLFPETGILNDLPTLQMWNSERLENEWGKVQNEC